MDIEQIADLIKKVVSIPRYYLVGLTRSGYIVFNSTQEGVFKLYSIEPGTGRIRSLVDEPIYMIVRTSRNSDVVLYTVDVSRGYEMVSVCGVDAVSGRKFTLSEGVKPHRIVGLGYDGIRVAWSGSVGSRAFIYMSKVSNGVTEPIVEISGREAVSDVSEKYIAGSGHLKGDPFTTELFIINIATREMRVYTPREGSVNRHPKLFRSKVLFESNFEDLDRFKLYVYDIEAGEISKVETKHTDLKRFDPVEYVNFGWTADGRIWAIGKKHGSSKLFIDGAEVRTPEGMILSADIGEDYAYVTHTSMRDPARMLKVDLRSSRYETIIGVDVPREIAESLRDVLYVEVESEGGVRVPTYVLISSKAPLPGPTIAYPHGGPWSEVSNAWTPLLALLVSLGYHVVAPNFRGSTGYGERFRKLDLGDPGGGDLADLVNAVEWAVRAGVADRERLAVFGYSYGGYLSFMAMVKYPEMWKCGIAGAGVTDWNEDYELADAFFKRYDEILFAGKKELFTDRSPITYIDRVKSPICIIHPQNDSRCPLRPIMKFAYKLMELERTFELHVIPDIGHAISLDSNAMAKYLLYSTVFLNTHLSHKHEKTHER
ncbi:MAG: S9 family peptidase [Sulfolobales archaeon]|nr:S9 family peptidase [Sulfolobales archaeon]MDW8083307.1 S9 family peptidase [Sulfolobales archaeon]